MTLRTASELSLLPPSAQIAITRWLRGLITTAQLYSHAGSDGLCVACRIARQLAQED